MAQTFAPGLHRAGAAGAIEPYTSTRRSVEQIAQEARVARHDPDVRAWAIDALARAGLDGRAQTGSLRQRVQVLLDALRAVTTYVPDPAGTEWIQRPHVTLCLRNLCIKGGDCDDLLLCLVALCLSVGIPAQLVKQNLGAGAQEHILMGFKSESGEKLYADPANTTAPVYAGSRAAREWWIDPMAQVGETGSTGADFVTLGSAAGSIEAKSAPPMLGSINHQLAPRARVGFGLVSVSDLDQLDQQLQAQIQALQDAANACTALTQSDKDALAGFVAAWGSIHTQWQGLKTWVLTWWNPGAAIAQVVGLQLGSFANDMQGYVSKVTAWQARIQAVCSNYTPPPGVVTPTPLPQAQSPGAQTAEMIGSAAKAVGALVVTGVVAYGVFKGIELIAPVLAKKR